MQQINISAPGKLMLLGDHAVVYKRPCLVTGVNQRLHMSIIPIQKQEFILRAPDVSVDEYIKPYDLLGRGVIPKSVSFIETAIQQFIKVYPLTTGVQITTKSDFSPLFGFGSSSAATVCAIAGLAQLTGTKLSKKEIFTLSYKTVQKVQKTGSGFDVACAIYGGLIYFVGGGGKIRQITNIPLPLLVFYTGTKADTPTVVRMVAKSIDRNPLIFRKLFTVSDSVVEKGLHALNNKNYMEFGELMNINEGLLASYGVETETLNRLVAVARQNGAYGAKLSGAGMGDCIIVLTSQNNQKQIIKAVEMAGGVHIPVQTSAQGVRIDEKIL